MQRTSVLTPYSESSLLVWIPWMLHSYFCRASFSFCFWRSIFAWYFEQIIPAASSQLVLQYSFDRHLVFAEKNAITSTEAPPGEWAKKWSAKRRLISLLPANCLGQQISAAAFLGLNITLAICVLTEWASSINSNTQNGRITSNWWTWTFYIDSVWGNSHPLLTWPVIIR